MSSRWCLTWHNPGDGRSRAASDTLDEVPPATAQNLGHGVEANTQRTCCVDTNESGAGSHDVPISQLFSWFQKKDPSFQTPDGLQHTLGVAVQKAHAFQPMGMKLLQSASTNLVPTTRMKPPTVSLVAAAGGVVAGCFAGVAIAGSGAAAGTTLGAGGGTTLGAGGGTTLGAGGGRTNFGGGNGGGLRITGAGGGRTLFGGGNGRGLGTTGGGEPTLFGATCGDGGGEATTFGTTTGGGDVATSSPTTGAGESGGGDAATIGKAGGGEAATGSTGDGSVWGCNGVLTGTTGTKMGSGRGDGAGGGLAAAKGRLASPPPWTSTS